MNIDWVIPCRYAEVHDNLATIVGGGIDTFWLPGFPMPVQVGMAIRLLATGDELGPEHEHTIGNVVRDPHGNVISELSDTFRAGSLDEAARARTEWLNGIALTTMVLFEAPTEGTYAFELTVDGSSMSVPLHIAQGPPPGMEPPQE